MADAHRFGRDSELAAEQFLGRSGYRVVTRNYRGAGGEIDLIAYDGCTLVFVEVKARRSRRFGTPQEALDHRKQRQLTKAALTYLSRHGDVSLPPCRFDLVMIEAARHGRAATFEVFRNVFSPSWEAL